MGPVHRPRCRNWTPKLDFTDQTLVYGSYAHGYKAGGANPPGAVFDFTEGVEPDHPLTFKPEFIDAFELGSKNTLLDGSLTLNADIFYYNYEDYQISEIVDRTAINLNFDAHVKGAEVEASWEPVPGLRFNFAGGWEQTDSQRARNRSSHRSHSGKPRIGLWSSRFRHGIQLHPADLCRCRIC